MRAGVQCGPIDPVAGGREFRVAGKQARAPRFRAERLPGRRGGSGISSWVGVLQLPEEIEENRLFRLDDGRMASHFEEPREVLYACEGDHDARGSFVGGCRFSGEVSKSVGCGSALVLLEQFRQGVLCDGVKSDQSTPLIDDGELGAPGAPERDNRELCLEATGFSHAKAGDPGDAGLPLPPVGRLDEGEGRPGRRRGKGWRIGVRQHIASGS